MKVFRRSCSKCNGTGQIECPNLCHCRAACITRCTVCNGCGETNYSAQEMLMAFPGLLELVKLIGKIVSVSRIFFFDELSAEVFQT